MRNLRGAAYFDASESALRFVDVDHCLPTAGMAPLLSRLSREPAPEEGDFPVPDDTNVEARVARLDPSIMHGEERPGALPIHLPGVHRPPVPDPGRRPPPVPLPDRPRLYRRDRARRQVRGPGRGALHGPQYPGGERDDGRGAGHPGALGRPVSRRARAPKPSGGYSWTQAAARGERSLRRGRNASPPADRVGRSSSRPRSHTLHAVLPSERSARNHAKAPPPFGPRGAPSSKVNAAAQRTSSSYR